MKDAKGHGSDSRGTHASGVEQVREHLVGAAYKVHGEIFQAPIHALALEQATTRYPDFKAGASDHGQFVTSTGRMVRRNEATEIAKAARQLNGRPMLHGGRAIDAASVNYRR